MLHQKDPRSNNNCSESFLALGYVNCFRCVIHSGNTDSVGMAEGLCQSSCRLRGFFPEGAALAESGCGGAKISVKKRHYKAVVEAPWGKEGSGC